MLSLCLLLVTGCSAGETNDSSAPLSPALEQLREETALVRCTANYEDLAFSKADFCDLTGEGTEYIVVNSLPEAGLLMLNGTAVIAGQTLPVSSLDYLKYVPSAKAGNTEVSFTFTSNAPGWENLELTCTVAVLENENFPPAVEDCTEETYASVACFSDILASDPNGDEITYKVTVYPRHGSIEIENGTAVYRPEVGFTGEDSFSYIATDYYGASSAEGTVNFSVVENESGIYFSDLADSPIHNAAIRLCESDVMTYQMKDGEYVFLPEETVSKIDCLVMMMCLLGQTEIVTAVTDTEAMDDGSLSAGKKGFLQAAIQSSAVYLENGAFKPEEAVTSADAAYMAMRLLGLPTLSAKQEFADLESTPAWACTALVSADSAGILEAEDGLLSAGKVLTREDVARVLDNMLKYGK